MDKIKYIVLLSTLFFFSCEYSEKLKTGEDVFALKQYYNAIPLLQDEYKQATDEEYKARKAYLIAEANAKMNRTNESIPWYKKANDAGFGLNAVLGLANAYRKIEEYAAAKYVIQTFEATNSSSYETRKITAACDLALQWQREQKDYDINIQKASFSTDYSEFGTAFYDGNLVVSSDQFFGDDDYYPWTGQGYSDLYYGTKNSTELIPLNNQINSKENEGSACFNQDGNSIFFTRCTAEQGDKYCKIFTSNRLDGEWSDPEIAIDWADNLNYGHPCLIANDSVMVFVAEVTEGYGGKDLWYSVWDDDQWSRPSLMPKQLNSEGDEMFPTAIADTMYYSSNGLAGLGGLDIFKTFLKANGTWSQPRNLRYPINSGADDFAYLIDPDSRVGNERGYFSSSRGLSGTDDVYAFTKVKKEKPPQDTLIVEEPLESPEYKVYLAVKVLEKTYNIPNNPNSGLKSKDVLSGATVGLMVGNKAIAAKRTNQDGRTITDITPGKAYQIFAEKKRYLSNSIDLDLVNLELSADTTINVEVALDKLIRGKEIVMDNIYYDYEQWDIRTDAEPSLNELTKMLQDNATLRIQLSSHTDCRGDADYNLDLSQKRAQSAVNYLAGEGIESSRLIAKGYGKSKLAVNCNCDDCTEDQHQVNRRTTFKILY